MLTCLRLDRDCLCQCLPLARSNIISANLGSLVTSASLFTHMLTCHRPTLSVTVFAVGSIEYVLCSFRQLAYVRLAIHEFTHLRSPDTVSDRVCRWRGSSILSATLFSLVTTESIFIHVLSCLRSTLSSTGLPLARTSILCPSLRN